MKRRPGLVYAGVALARGQAHVGRRPGALALVFAAFAFFVPFASAEEPLRPTPESVLGQRYRLVLDLVRHTATYSPPVASRAFAYLGVIAYEATASGRGDLKTLAGQLNGLSALPARQPGQAYDEAVVLDAALSAGTERFFDNTGPTGQRAMKALDAKLSPAVIGSLPHDVADRSGAYGRALAEAVSAWADGDKTGPIVNMGFPQTYTPNPAPGHWRPTSTIAQQQAPLLPDWGRARPFAMPTGASCDLPPPLPYSVDKDSAFYREALEVRDTSLHLTDEQKAIARFWSDDPMLSTTPPGHWIQIAFQIFDKGETPVDREVDLIARLSVAMADAFISCWTTKYEFDLVRPVTYIRANIDPAFNPILITPPFPEYPSGHSTQSAAAAEVMTQFFGDNYAFEDASHVRDGLSPRKFASFRAAADEAGVSRLYGGIHFRTAIERGLDQGRCVAAYANALKTRN
ncbi:MAG: vanadium-dependent haloperoxidase [Hyphomicrobiales bacterium]|nr:vanadium-dependent haloperoxidase [Hyphomicrobiales bacterium]